MESSYFYFLSLLFLFIISNCSTTMSFVNITTDQASLLTIKSSTTLDPDHILNTNWSTLTSVCDWVGVTCGLRHHRITALNISGMNLNGTLSPQLGNLSFLVSLDLSDNNFHGNIPDELVNLHRLRVIQMNYNFLSGEIPRWLGSLSELREISLGINNFTGLIPYSVSNLSNLEILNLKYNQLTGSIPSELFGISTLKTLYLEDNKFYGDLPIHMCQNLPHLYWLSLSENELSGQIPLSISNCSALRVLILSSNRFSGVIPKEIGKLVNLKQLYISNNGFSKGVIPQEFGNLRNLEVLDMRETQLIGSIPPVLFNISTLQRIRLVSNELEGAIPKEINNLHKLEGIWFRNNSLSGLIPIGIFNLSNLSVLSLSMNQFSGTLPSNMGYTLPNLEILNIFENNFRGVIPNFLSNSTKLVTIQLNGNEFSGEISDSLGDLRLLNTLALDNNNLTSQNLKIITSLTRSQNLRVLDFSVNPLHGSFPVSIGNFSSLKKLYAYECKINGSLPSEIGNSSKLIMLSIYSNYLTGQIPPTMKAIQGLYLGHNNIYGSTLNTLCELPNLFTLDLSHNNILGPIPKCLDKVASLRFISFRNNSLTSIPHTIWNLKNLMMVDFSSNSLEGSIPPEIGTLNAANVINLSMNHFSGNIPSTFAGLSSLQDLLLDHNRLEGSIPDILGKIFSLVHLDLSHNNLSGSIPKSFESLKYLASFNVSFNNLEGEIPFSGPFKNFTSQSFVFNDALCGDSKFQVPPCRVKSAKKKGSKKKLLLIFIPLGITVSIFVVMVFIFTLRRYQRKVNVIRESESFAVKKVERISYYELLEATDKYSESNLLGSGSFGSVYKGILKDGAFVAVKVFNLQLEDVFKSFETECEILRNLRHRNLTKVISSCCVEDFKALVLEYMPNGSLEKWLYSHNYFLNLMQRLNIMIDIASALEYLHDGYSLHVVHCDLKPSNVLLDENMVAHVSDFGISKLLGEGESISHTITLATMGYIAPEYGLEGTVSTRADVYSFGIMMMEVFTRTKPSSEMFVGDLSLKRWVSNSIPNNVGEVVDSNLIREDEQHSREKVKCLLSIMELALSCSTEFPNERIKMKNVVTTLNKIKLDFLAHCGEP